MAQKRKLRLKAFAKANLSLNITGTRGGLHTLDSVMISLDAFDTVTVCERADDKINVKFIGADIGADNTAYKAACAVREHVGGGWDIEVEKGIPIGGGLGGSSADGAAVLRALDIFYKLPARGVDMRSVALSVGSDVPFMLTGGLARVRGAGEDLFFIENKLELFAVGLMHGGVSTKEAYARFDAIYKGKAYCPTDTDKMCDRLLAGERSALELCGNALYAPAVEIDPEIAHNAKLLESCGAVVNMTGSGGTVLGYFTDMAKFVECVGRLRDRAGFKVFAPVKTGILHEWID